MDKRKPPGLMTPENRVSDAIDNDKSGSKGMKSPTKVGSPKASPAQPKKVSQDAHTKTGANESGLQERCQVLEEHLTKERLAKAQVRLPGFPLLHNDGLPSTKNASYH